MQIMTLNDFFSFERTSTEYAAWCCKCETHIENMVAFHDPNKRVVRFVFKCHGSSDTRTVTSSEFNKKSDLVLSAFGVYQL